MIFCFSAGNSGASGPMSIGSPALAKNVISVGAGENSDRGELDGSYIGPSDSDDLRDIAFFSSRGPTADGRIMPTVFAPGTHVTGAASDDKDYNGSGVSGRYNVAPARTLGDQVLPRLPELVHVEQRHESLLPDRGRRRRAVL